jgi:hypothetical protein
MFSKMNLINPERQPIIGETWKLTENPGAGDERYIIIKILGEDPDNDACYIFEMIEKSSKEHNSNQGILGLIKINRCYWKNGGYSGTKVEVIQVVPLREQPIKPKTNYNRLSFLRHE